MAFFKGFNPDISISGIFFKKYFWLVIQYSIEFYQNNIIKIKKYFIFIWFIKILVVNCITINNQTKT
jgi:hypothetical protein